MKCVNCNNEEFKDSSNFPGAIECSECGFLKAKSTVAHGSTIILPDDPMDSFACESCQ